MSFTPKGYSNFGKTVKDLCSDDFTYKNSLTVKHKTACGMTVQSQATVKGNGFDGAFKLKCKNKQIGDMEFNGSTKDVFSAKVKLAEFAQGVKATLKATLGGKKPSDPHFSLVKTLDYSTEHVAVSLETTANEKDSELSGKVKVSGVFGFDGVSLGGECSTNFSNKFDLSNKDFKMAFEIAEDDFSFGLATGTDSAKNLCLTGSFFQQVAKGHSRGIKFVNSENSTNILTLVTKYDLDNSTSLKTSVSTEGVVQNALTHTLSNPSAKLNLATKFKTSNGFDWSAQEYGLGVTLGDF